MIFSELYSAYYNTVAKIMEAAFNPEATEKDMQRCVMEEAFSESHTSCAEVREMAAASRGSFPGSVT